LEQNKAHVVKEEHHRRISGVYSGVLASFLLGWAPILGKFAYQADVDPMTLASLRTLVAAAFLWAVYLLVWRRRIGIQWRLIAGCLVVGAINGVGSLFYYTGLDRLDASRAALLGAMYPVWVVIFLSASGQVIRTTTLVQLAASMLGAVFITSPWRMDGSTDFLGAMLMIASAAVNGWYIVMGQWVLADVPSRSGTLYIMTGMALTVVVARLLGGGLVLSGIPLAGWEAVVALGLTTALSRMAMFFSLEKLGGVQTAILSLLELAISLALAFVFLGDRLAWFQWLGAVLLLGGGLLARHTVEHQAETVTAFDPIEATRHR
jgi:drug/metabolite transporter (DMT)-like permease